MQSKRAGVKNTPSTVALTLSIIFIVLGIIVAIIVAAVGAAAAAALLQQCATLGTGIHDVNGVTITCN